MADFEQKQDMTTALHKIVQKYDDSQILNELRYALQSSNQRLADPETQTSGSRPALQPMISDVCARPGSPECR